MHIHTWQTSRVCISYTYVCTYLYAPVHYLFSYRHFMMTVFDDESGTGVPLEELQKKHE